MPAEVRDYVIVHEICHIKEFNHARGFWQLVAETVPDWKGLRKKLREIERSGDRFHLTIDEKNNAVKYAFK
jgi:predicted metal-dependent hydrolase